MVLGLIPAPSTKPPDISMGGNVTESLMSSIAPHDIDDMVSITLTTGLTTLYTEAPVTPNPFCIQVLYETIGNSHVRYWDLALLIPNFLFLLFLLLRSRIATLKLRQSNRPILFTFYALVFTVTVVSVARAVVSMLVDARKDAGDIADTLLWIIVKFFLVGVELCVVIFGVGFSHLDSNSSVINILLITSVVSLTYSITQGVLELKFPDEHYINPYDIYSHGGMLFWSISSFIFFLCILLYYITLTKVRERIQLPVKHSFYIYVATLAVLYLCQGIASLLVYLDFDGGSCATDVTTFLYFSFFAPLIYLSFLHNFFRSTKQPLLLSYAGQDDDTDEVHPLPTPPFVISKEEPVVNRQTPPYQSIYDSTEFLHGSPPQITGQLAFRDGQGDNEEETTEGKHAVPTLS
ncbi:putative transmembrane protein [Apostichopus japonicus]|uniref:Putative transmembrane protein n=1 Tax=Stichopus japonicus TaxID=307972 RepID=A0A2G8LCP6_STIJA|nr:putative transmembrane protein [Apostichopus japonicus]